MPLDIVFFLITVALFFAVGLPTIVRRLSLPAVVDFQVVEEQELSPAQLRAFTDLDGSLAPLGYRPALNFRPTNLQGDALIRAYLSDADPAVLSLDLLRSDTPGGEDISTSYLELTTNYSDGTVLNTRNSEVSEVFDPLPEQIIQECRGTTDPAALKKIHDRRAADLQASGPEYRRAADLLERFQAFHDRWCAHQVARGLLKTVDAEGRHGVTVRTGLRGIRNFLNPFADNFTPLRLLLVALFGLLLPVTATVWLGDPDNPVCAALAEPTGWGFDTCYAVALIPVFTVIGIAVGLLFSTKSFIWTFVIAYLPLRLLGPSGLAPLWLSLWASIVAAGLTSIQNKRKALL